MKASELVALHRTMGRTLFPDLDPKAREWYEAGIEVTAVAVDVVYDAFDAFLTHHIAGTVDKAVLMKARASMPPQSANALKKEKP